MGAEVSRDVDWEYGNDDGKYSDYTIFLPRKCWIWNTSLTPQLSIHKV